MTDEQRRLLKLYHRRFPGVLDLLWRYNVIHGEQVLALPSCRRRAIFPADAGDMFLAMSKAEILKPVSFRPSHSGAAFVGLIPGAARESRTAPHAGDAAHWTWEVLGEFTQLLVEKEK